MTGRIVFGDDPPVFTNARVSIRLEDTTYVDAPARAIAERVMEPVAYDGGATGIPFSLDVPAGTGRVRMTLQVLVDLEQAGKLRLTEKRIRGLIRHYGRSRGESGKRKKRHKSG